MGDNSSNCSKVNMKGANECCAACTRTNDGLTDPSLQQCMLKCFIKGQCYGRYHDFWPKFAKFKL